MEKSKEELTQNAVKEYFSDLYRRFRKPLWIGVGAIVGLWVLVGALIILALPGWAARGQFGDLFGAVNSLFSGLALAGVVVALLLQSHEIRTQHDEIRTHHDWNRRREAHELLMDACLGRFRLLRDRIETKIAIYDRNQTYETVQGQLDANDVLALEACLNYIENVCLAMKNHIIDEDIAFDSLSEILLSYTRWAKPYISTCRAKFAPRLWIEIDTYEQKWSERRQEIMGRLREPGKNRL